MNPASIRELCAVLCLWWVGASQGEAQTRPNIILLLADDLGFSSIDTYGGDVETPNLDDLAASGAKFNNYYVQPRCSPTRAALMTGHQNHKVGFSVLIGDNGRLTQNHVFLPELLGDNGYDTYLSGKWHLGATDNFGSLGPVPGNSNVDPRVRGFDHAFTFIGSGHSERNWAIGDYRLLSDDQGPGAAFTAPGDRYVQDTNGDYNRYNTAGVFTDSGAATPEFYQTDAIMDYTLDFLAHHRAKNAANGTSNPFFQYVAFGAPHFPIEAPQEVVNKYATVNPDGSVTGQYAGGWDAVRSDRLQQMIAKGVIPSDLVLSPRGDAYLSPGNDGGKVQLIPWADVPADRKPTLIRAMEVYAAMVDVVDQQVGRLVSDLKANGEFDNTLILFMTDNGANPEGDVYGLGDNPQEDDPPPGPLTVTQLELMGTAVDPLTSDQRAGTGWANVEVTPFRNYKHFEHEGGIKSPLIVSWPDGLAPSLTSSSTDYADGNNDLMHVTDVMPTLLDLLGIELPDQYTALNGAAYGVVDFNRTTVSWADLLTSGTPLGEREFGSMHENNRMYRKGDWKIVSSNYAGNDGDDSTANNTTATGESPVLIAANEWELYNLADDPSELHNLAGDPAHQAIFNELLTKYSLWAFETNVNSSLPNATSDFNFDGQQDAEDLALFINNWLRLHPGGGNIDSYMLGDRNSDGVNDLADWVLIRQDFLAAGQGALLARVSLAAPEPCAATMAAFSVATLGIAGRCTTSRQNTSDSIPNTLSRL
ncbi:MAG: sulfatase-like hydrolase/transferase [Planctomycetales bacterium]|nr:sulfatase-like hydrolase/transferase [Planctomycetales bacterium]